MADDLPYSKKWQTRNRTEGEKAKLLRKAKRMAQYRKGLEYKGVKGEIWKRSGGQCENPLCRCHGGGDDMRFDILDPCHIRRRSDLRIDDPAWMFIACRWTHDRIDYGDGKYMLTVLKAMKEKNPAMFPHQEALEWLEGKLSARQ